MLVHSVYFWLKPELDDAQRESFRGGVESLRGIETVRHCWIGTPADTTQRPVIDASHSFALVVVFDDMAGHDEYQDHKTHQEFVSTFSDFWSRVVVYDAD